VLYLEARDPHGRFIHRWSWPVQHPARVTEALTGEDMRIQVMVSVAERNNSLIMEASGIRVEVDKRTGMLVEASSGDRVIPLTGGPVFHTRMPDLMEISHFDKDGNHHIVALYERGQQLEWIMTPTGMVDMLLRYKPLMEDLQGREGKAGSTGASFSYPEEEIGYLHYLGSGPYRIWKNRMKGPEFGRWEKTYNNTITGHSGYEYPEFKGYYGQFYWAEIGQDEAPSFRVYSHTPDLFLRMLTPEEAPDPAKTTLDHVPGDLGFMKIIPPIGTKFKHAIQLGPQSRHSRYMDKRVEGGALEMHLTFDFRQKQEVESEK
jgi:hypothetical protein